MYGSIRQELGSIIRDLAQHKESEVEEGHLMADHVHMMLTIPPKYSVSGVVGYIKGKSAIAIARRYMDRKKNFVGLSLWARGTTCQQWDETRRKCASTSESRRKKTDGSIN
jgi:putative transposase